MSDGLHRGEIAAALAPRRLRAQDVIEQQHEALLAALTRSGEPYVTVEHTLNAKGDTQTSVKVSAPMGCDLQALDVHSVFVENLAAHTYDEAIARYPRTNGETK